MDFDQKKYIIRYVAIYIRKSRAESMEDLEKHRMVLIDLCKRSNFKYVEYMEVGTSDSIDLRPQICKLLKEVEEGVYDAVCVVEYDRLGRGDLGEQDRLKKAFQKSNTLIITPDKIYDLNDDIDDTFADLKGFFARQEYKMITKRLRQGKKIGARRGQWTNGTPPFPYVYETYKDKYNPKGIVVDDDKYCVYRLIVEEALKGIPPKNIAETLNRKGLLTAKSKYWSGVTVLRLLLDETHLGKIISNKSQGDGHKNKRPNAKPLKYLPKSEWVVVENCHQAVKTQEEHDQILMFIGERTKVPTRSRKHAHALTALIKCGVCGHTLSFYSQGKEYVKPCWYTDSFGKKCDNNGILAEVIEKIVLEEISKYKNELIKKIEVEGNVYLEQLYSFISEKENTLAKYRKALEIVNDAYELGDYPRDEWIRRKGKWIKAIEQTQTEIYDLKKKIRAQQETSNEERTSKLTSFLENIILTTDVSERNDLYRTIINWIVYTRAGDDINISINFK